MNPQEVLSRLSDKYEKLKQLIPKVTSILFAVIFVFLVYRSLSDEAVIFEPLDVPSELETKGYSGRVITNKLIDAVVAFRNTVKTDAQLAEFRSTWQASETEIDIEVAGFSSQKVIKLFRYLLGIPSQRISGEITLANNHLQLNVRVGNSSHIRKGQLDSLDKLVQEIAPLIVKDTDPYFFAVSNVEKDPKTCLKTIRDLLNSEQSKWHPWAYNLWGRVLKEHGDHENARSKFLRVLELGWPRYRGDSIRDAKAAAYNNLGIIYQNENKFTLAEDNFQSAIKVKPTYALAYSNLAKALTFRKKYDQALKLSSQAIELNPSSAQLYYERGLIFLESKRDADKAVAAVADFKVALALNLENSKASDFADKLSQYYPNALYELGFRLINLENCSTDAIELFKRYIKQVHRGKHCEWAKVQLLQFKTTCHDKTELNDLGEYTCNL